MNWLEEEFSKILTPDYLSELSRVDLQILREMRAECESVEVMLSFGRRMTEGRLDLIRATLDSSESASDDVDGLLQEEGYSMDRLASVMASGPSRPSGPGRVSKPFAPDFAPDFGAGDIMRELNEIISEEKLAHLQELGSKELSDILPKLVAIESRLSSQRHTLHGILDTLEGEIARRYKDGLATVDSLVNERRGMVTG